MQPATLISRTIPTIPWPDKTLPSAISYTSRALADLEMITVDGLLAMPRVGIGVGGVLLGRKGTGRIDILNSVEIVCSHAMGPAFILTLAEVAVALRQVQKIAADADSGQLVGWYCSKTNGPLELTDSDRVLYDILCPEPWHVALLIKPSQAGTTTALFAYRGHRSFGERESTFRLGVQHEFPRAEPGPYRYSLRPEPEDEGQAPDVSAVASKPEIGVAWPIPARVVVPRPFEATGRSFGAVPPAVEPGVEAPEPAVQDAGEAALPEIAETPHSAEATVSPKPFEATGDSFGELTPEVEASEEAPESAVQADLEETGHTAGAVVVLKPFESLAASSGDVMPADEVHADVLELPGHEIAAPVVLPEPSEANGGSPDLKQSGVETPEEVPTWFVPEQSWLEPAGLDHAGHRHVDEPALDDSTLTPAAAPEPIPESAETQEADSEPPSPHEASWPTGATLFGVPDPGMEPGEPKRRRWPTVVLIILLVLAGLAAAAYFTRESWMPLVIPSPQVALIASSDWTGRVTFLWSAEALAKKDHATLELANGRGSLVTIRLDRTQVSAGMYQYDCQPGPVVATLLAGEEFDIVTVRAQAETYLPESGISK